MTLPGFPQFPDESVDSMLYPHQGTGGKSQYKKKHPEHHRKLPSKQIGCSCQLQVKCYPDTEKVLRKYKKGYSHPIGDGNIIHTRLSQETHFWMVEMVWLGFTHQKIVSVAYLRDEFGVTDQFLWSAI